MLLYNVFRFRLPATAKIIGDQFKKSELSLENGFVRTVTHLFHPPLQVSFFFLQFKAFRGIFDHVTVLLFNIAWRFDLHFTFKTEHPAQKNMVYRHIDLQLE